MNYNQPFLKVGFTAFLAALLLATLLLTGPGYAQEATPSEQPQTPTAISSTSTNYSAVILTPTVVTTSANEATSTLSLTDAVTTTSTPPVTDTPTATPSTQETDTPTATPSAMATGTPTATLTPPPTDTPAATPAVTATNTPPPPPTLTSTATPPTPTLSGQPELKITAPLSVTLGAVSQTITVTLQNTGNAPATNVTVDAVVPPELQLIGISAGGATKEQNIYWNFQNLAADEVRNLSITLEPKADAPPNAPVNLVITYSSAEEPDPQPVDIPVEIQPPSSGGVLDFIKKNILVIAGIFLGIVAIIAIIIALVVLGFKNSKSKESLLTDGTATEPDANQSSPSPSSPPYPEVLPTTIPVSPAPDSGVFPALSEGARLPSQQPQYQILRVLSKADKINVYQAQTLQPVRLCVNPGCARQTNQPICPDCASQTSEPMLLSYIIKESSDQNITFLSLRLAEDHQLKHPDILIYDRFIDSPYDNQPRYYVLELEPGPQLADNLPLPQEIWKVLDWGRQLAEALVYLHSKSLVWQMLTERHLAVEDKRAYWINLNIKEAQSPADDQNDVRRLAELLFYLATGARQYAYPTQLPAVVGNLFEQLLGQPATTMKVGALAQALKSVAAELRRPTNARLTAYAQTDVGRVRDHNEDSFMTQEMVWSNVGTTYPLGLYVVADGMGGHSAGEVASGQVISYLSQKMAEHILRLRPDGAEFKAFEPGAWLQTTIQAANKTVFDQAKQTGNDMGTTLVAALVLGEAVHIAHIGDSRAYLLNQQQIRPLTTDHSVVERLIATNQITREQARSHPQRNVIYRTIGDKANIEVEGNTYRLTAGDCLLLCSDGLTGTVTDEELHRIYINHQHDLAEACRQMITAANNAGGDDNVTAILIAYTTYESRA